MIKEISHLKAQKKLWQVPKIQKIRANQIKVPKEKTITNWY